MRDLSDTDAVLPPGPELDDIVDRILETGAPYPGSHPRWSDRNPGFFPSDPIPQFSYLHAAVAFALGLLIGFAASAILL